MIRIVLGLFVYAAILSYLLPVFVALKNRSGLVNFNRPIFALIISNLLFVIVEIWFSFWIKNANPVQHISVFVTTILIFSYFHSIKFHRKVLVILFYLACFIFVFESFITGSLMENNTLMGVYSNVSISLISFIHLFELFKYDDKNVIEFKFLFYVSTAFFIFNSSSFYVNLFETQIRAELGYLPAIIYPIFSILMVVQNIILTNAIWTLKRI